MSAQPLRDSLQSFVTYAQTLKGDTLAFLLALNHDLAAKEKAGAKITPPGLPLPATEHASFITEDCIICV